MIETSCCITETRSFIVAKSLALPIKRSSCIHDLQIRHPAAAYSPIEFDALQAYTDHNRVCRSNSQSRYVCRPIVQRILFALNSFWRLLTPALLARPPSRGCWSVNLNPFLAELPRRAPQGSASHLDSQTAHTSSSFLQRL